MNFLLVIMGIFDRTLSLCPDLARLDQIQTPYNLNTRTSALRSTRELAMSAFDQDSVSSSVQSTR